MLEIAHLGEELIKDCHSLSLVVIGVNNRTMPLELFERFVISEDAIPKALADVQSRRNVSEALVLSTCNRTEVYVYAEKFHGAYQDVRDFLAETARLAPEEFNDYLYAHYEDEAIQHLFSVTCGLDSAIVGENEVVHQIKMAWELAREEDSCGPVVNSAFRRALEVGKKIRTETTISKNTLTISQACVEMAKQHLDNFKNQEILVVGAGEIGEGIAKTLSELQAEHVYFANRNFDRAKELADSVNGQSIPFEEIEKTLERVDVLISSTAASSVVLNQSELMEIMKIRNGRKLLIVDIAVPRDVDPSVAQIEGVTLLDIDALWSFHAQTSLTEEETEIGKAKTIIVEEISRFLEQQSARKVAPLISEFREGAEEIRQIELKRFEARLAGFTDEQREVIEALTQGILGKILHDPTISLNEAAGSPRGERLADALRELFNL
ncbi:MAG TPA: glutamyl-tRNA reductase [Acidimicrobiales bacterium]|jgi:glutamyl-tRNA reductase|nr:glutamyl-tRNA reductase [Acidimicrobiales bacterium]